ncbi:zona pellucida sperm-binding protein 3-like isoform X2 [Brienomyrus brachyistius]|uniref:zona pellucida sperm-binding protein 3-like isoform X2 n=1 Tax=Brienomyrus brachyistius TaxID=42636 RepID=UPI0020B25076|nr:zona pellucida sperm-binding protein 3-like isoform X2 [Brienomyrus brachyistius]
MALQCTGISAVVLSLLVCVCTAQFNPQNSQQWLPFKLPLSQANTMVSSSNAVIQRLPQLHLLQAPLSPQATRVPANPPVIQRLPQLQSLQVPVSYPLPTVNLPVIQRLPQLQSLQVPVSYPLPTVNLPVIQRLPQLQSLQVPVSSPLPPANPPVIQRLQQQSSQVPVSYPLPPAGQLVDSKLLPPLYLVPQSQPVVQGAVKSQEAVPTRLQVQSVSAECQESSVLVAVHRDLFGIGRLIDPSDVTLGGCASTGQDASGQVLMFQTELQNCGSTIMMTEDTLVYTFTLTYTPKELGPGAPIVRTNAATVNIACHYLRKQNVSSNALVPTWVPFLTTLSAVDHLVFTLRLMTDDWKAERTSNVYSLGDVVNIEAAVMVSNHVPLRVFVDSCVATLVPDLNAVPSYTFVVNHGCLIDAKLTGSHTQFMPRTQDDKLQMQLETFRFSQQNSSSMYITCLLKATLASAALDMGYKACSFSAVANRWVAASGGDELCGCCDTSCDLRKGRSLDESLQWQDDALLGPFTVLEEPLLADVEAEAQELARNAVESVATGFSAEMVALAGIVAAVALVSMVVLGVVIRWK